MGRVTRIASVASVSVGFGSKERARNGIFGILPAKKKNKKRKMEVGEGKEGNAPLVTL